MTFIYVATAVLVAAAYVIVKAKLEEWAALAQRHEEVMQQRERHHNEQMAALATLEKLHTITKAQAEIQAAGLEPALCRSFVNACSYEATLDETVQDEYIHLSDLYRTLTGRLWKAPDGLV